MEITGFTTYPTRDMSQADFDPAADTFIGEIEQFVADANATAASVNSDAASASASAALAQDWAADASTSEVAAQGYASAAQASANSASGSATAAINAPGTQATSTDSRTIGTGSFNFTIQTGKSLVAGMWLLITATSDLTKWMVGQITAYNSGTGALTVSVPASQGATNGTGTVASWQMTLHPAWSAAIAWSQLTNKPTTVAGYGITDAVAASQFTPVYTAVAASLTLPALNGYAYASCAVCAPSNATAVPSTITTSDGWSVTTGFVAGTLKVIAATYLGTAHGIWPGLTMTPPTAGTFTASGTPVVRGTVQLDTDLYAILYKVSTSVFVNVYRPSTNTWGTPTVLSATASTVDLATIHKVTTSSFVVTVAISGDVSIQALSVNTSTLAFSTGAQVTGSAAGTLAECALQLSSSLYVIHVSSATADLRAFSVSGTTVTLGTAVFSGQAPAATGTQHAKIARVDDTTFLVAYYGAGGGSSSTRCATARTGSISGTTITLNTAVNGASNTLTQGSLVSLVPLVESATGLYIWTDNQSNTVSNLVVVALTSATTVSAVGAPVNIGQGMESGAGSFQSYDQKTTWVAQPAKSVVKFNSTTLLLGTKQTGAGVFTGCGFAAATVSGTTITLGSIVAKNQSTYILADSTYTTFFATSTDTDIVSVTGSTASSSATLTGAVATFLPSSTLSDKAVKYGSTWYAWTLGPGSFDAILTPSVWVAHATTTVTAYGPVT